MTTGHYNPGNGRVMTRLIGSPWKADDRAAALAGQSSLDQLEFDQIRQKARDTWCQAIKGGGGGGGESKLQTTYRNHFQGLDVGNDQRTKPRPTSPTRIHKPQSSKWFYTTTFNSSSEKKKSVIITDLKAPNDDQVNSSISSQQQQQQQQHSQPKKTTEMNDNCNNYEADRRAIRKLDEDMKTTTRRRNDGTTHRGEFSMHPEWKPKIVHHRLRGLSPPLHSQYYYATLT